MRSSQQNIWPNYKQNFCKPRNRTSSRVKKKATRENDGVIAKVAQAIKVEKIMASLKYSVQWKEIADVSFSDIVFAKKKRSSFFRIGF